MFQFEEDNNFFGEDPFEIYSRENNTEAIRALLNDQFQSFEDIVTKHYPKTLVLLTPCKIHNTIETPEIIKADFEALLGEKIAKIMVSQGKQDRYLQSPFQIGLHYFIKNVYSDSKTKLKMPEIVIRSYQSLAANIIQLQDFINFLKLIRLLNLTRVFEEVEPQLLKFFSEEQTELMDWKFVKSYANFDEQRRLITKLHNSILIERLSKQKTNRNQRPYKFIVDKLRDYPYQRLLSEMLDNNISIFNAQFNQVILKSHLDCDYKADTYRLNVDNIHPSLREWSTVFSVFKNLPFKEGFRCVVNSPVMVQNNHVLLRYNYQMLSHLVDEGSSIYLRSLDSQLLTKYLSFFKLLLEHSDLPFITIGDSNHDDVFSIKYTCKAFELLQKAMDNCGKYRANRNPIHLTETFIIGWIKILNKWLTNKKVTKQKFLICAIESVFSIFEYTDNEQNPEFPGLLNVESEISKCLCEMMLELQNFQFSCSGWKGVSLVLLKWGQSIIAQNDSYKQLIKKLLHALFDSNFNISVHRGEDLFDTPAISKVFKKMLSQELYAIIQVKVVEIQKEQINNSQHPAIKKYNNFILKIAMILSSKIPFDLIDGIAKLLYRLYRDYAHIWPLLYSFRLWILQMGHQSVETYIEASIDVLVKLTNELSNDLQQQKIKNDVHEFNESTIHKFSEFEYCSNRLINTMQLKKHKDVYSASIYSKYFTLIHLLEAKYMDYASILNNQVSDMKQWIIYGVNIGRSLLKIKQDFKMNIRYYLCNSSKLLHVKEEEHIMSNIAFSFNSILKGDDSFNTWKFINDLSGFNQKHVKTNLMNRQILGPLSRYTSKHNPLFKIDQFLPFNFLSTLYTAIRHKYSDILRVAFKGLEQNNNDEQIWQTIQKILLPSVNTSGPCLFNGQSHQKSKEEMVLGIYYQQFEKLTEVLIEGKELAKVDINTVVKLQKRKLLSKFLQILKLKTCKIVEKVRNNPPQPRYRSRPSTVQDVITGLFQMGIPRDQAEIALQNIEYPDQNLAVEWIDGNQDRLEQLVMQRAMDRSRNEGIHKITSVRQNEKSTDLVIGVLPYQKFSDKEKILKCIRTWIKGIYKQLFQTEQLPRAEEIKQLLFLFMDYLKPETIRIKQYDNLNQKVYKDLDQLNREENITGRIKILMSILEGTFDKVPKAKTEFYSKAINLKILSFLPRINEPQNQIKLFELINATLPVFSPSDNLTPETKNYLNYLLDLTFKYRHPQKYLSDILFKIGKSKNQAFMQRITRNFTLFLQENLIQDNIMPLITLIFQCDPQLNQINAELDLKTYLFERYKGKLTTFHPEKQHVLQIDMKEFASNFSKYDKGSAIYEVSKKLLTKKKNKNRFFYYDCRREDCAFDYSSFGNCFFVNHGLKDNQRRIINSLLSILFKSTIEQQEHLILQIHKILLNYRILIPYTISETVEGENLIDWLLANHNHSKSKHKLLVFLTLNSNLFIRTTQTAPYSFYSIADYVCARIVKHLFKSDTRSTDENVWKFFSSLYLLQVKKFSQYASTLVSQDNKITLEDFYESLLPTASQKQFLTLSEFLYIQYKRRLLDNLRRKYKFVRSQDEDSFDRQFLNISPFFNSLPIKQTEERQRGRPDRLIAAQPERQNELQLGQEQYNEQQMIMGENVRMRFVNRNQGQPRGGVQLQQLIVPIQQKQNKQAKQNNQQEQQIQPIVIRNQFYIEDVLRIFEQYLSFEEEIEPNAYIQDAEIPNNAIMLPNQNASFKATIEELPLDIEMKVAKLAGFQKRMTEVVLILDSSIVWQKKKENDERGRGRLPQQLSRRLLNLNHLTSQNRQQMIAHLERMASRLYREQQPQVQQNVRVLNTADIFQNVQQFIQPILPPIVQKQVEQPMIIEPQPQKQEQKPELPKQQSIVGELVEILPLPTEQVIVVQDSSMPALLNNIAELNVQENVPHEQQMQIEQNNPIQQEIAQNIVPVVNEIPIPIDLIQQVIGQPQIPPVPRRDRQILRVYGLPQTYLIDVGLDEQLFDQLPEDLQQEQLMQYIAQHGNNANRSQPNNPQPNQTVVIDQQSQNLAFIASLDHLTRTQVLLEATPEFLNTLPAAIREQAERYRHQQISSIIEEEQIEEQRTFNNQKVKNPVVYPKVHRQQFSKISEETARVLFEGIFMVQPSFKLSVIKLLIENKQTQEKTISSIITLLKYFELKAKEIVLKTRMSKIIQMVDVNNTLERRNINVENMNYIRKYLLHIIYEHLKSPLYADEEFITNQLYPDCYCQDILEEVKSTQSYEPQTELLYFALCYYPDLATELVKKAKDLPNELLTKIVQLIRKDSLPKQFYNNLQNFSDNVRLKEIFSIQFQDRPPETQVLGLLLKYKFSHLLCLRRIHAQSLEYFSPKYREFLNQIFSIYTIENISEIEPLLLKHKQTHFEVIKYLYETGRELEKEPIGLILKKPHLLDFQTKKFIFRNHPRIRKQARHRVQIEVDRNHLFQGSYNQLMSRTVRELEGRIQVAFINEPGYDAGGLKREWFLVVSREIFNQNYCLFQKSSSGSTYQPNPKSYVNPDHLNYFKFIGRFIGKALVERELIDAFFTRAFYKMILGQQLQFKDLEQQDYQFYKSMLWLKENNIDQNMFTFSYIYDNFGNRVQKELVAGGKSIIVDEANKKEYIEKYCLAKMRDDFSAQINKFLEGFHQIVPQECISYFEAKQLELLISGVPEVDIDDLKSNTDYSGYNPTDQIIVWFWEVVSQYSQEDLAKLVQFITGTSKIPVQGFSQIVGMNGIQRISIHRDPCDHQLPKSHTCFNQLDLPNYATKQILKTKLGICLAWGSEGFGFM